MSIGWFSLLIINIISFTNANPTQYTAEPRHIPVRFFKPIIAPSLAGRCYGCLVPSSDCTVPCSSPQRCFIRGPTPYNQVTDRRCTDERWVRDLLVDGCLTYNGLYWCMCSTDLCNSGDFSSIRGFDDCSSNPCPSGTICLDTKDGFSCICPPWQDDCTYAFTVGCTCKNGGRCIMGLGTYICECPYGYTGVNCEIRLRRQSSSSLPSPCPNQCERRTCTYRQSGFGLAPASCTCLPPSHYASSRSTCNTYRTPQPYVACNPNPCQHGQSCHLLTPVSFFCDACVPNPCQNGGSCVFDEPTGSFRCYCPAGYTGRTCDIDSAITTVPPDPCLPNPCRNGGTCQANNAGNFTCLCPAGFQGICCEIRSNPCVPSPCFNNGMCMASGTSFVCSCRNGFSGQRCEIRDPCFPNPCLNSGQCSSNGIGGFTCMCIQPYTGQRCEDRIDPCANQPCRNGGTCRPLNGNSYQCICPPGYSGYDCSIRDPCFQNPCLNGGQCDSTGMVSFTCICIQPYTGQRCEDRDPCASQPCMNQGTCVGENGGFRCTCPLGYSGNLCEIQDACQSNPCMNGGTCQRVNGNGGYQCACPSGFSGPRCETRDPCAQNPCLNGGQCYPSNNGGFTCQCPAGFSGQRCEDQDSCAAQPCQNRGVCVSSDDGSYVCQCRTGFQGRNCEQIDICGVKNPCICGTCQNDPYNPQGFICFCPPNYSGSRCEKILNCMDSGEDCMNGGQCIQRPLGDYVCSCPYPYCGSRCQSQRPSCGTMNTYPPPTTTPSSAATCSSSQCNNRGICQEVDHGRGIQCYCSTGWSGSRCQFSLSCKDNQQCSNGGVCREIAEDISVCQCSPQFWGERCEHAYEPWSQPGYDEQQQQQDTHNEYHNAYPPTADITQRSVSSKTKTRKQTSKN
ncbi:unnamed protein product [Rotaria sp. Silwood2]|nr:unnamed protein product [Rotaria sp. Silwood2]